MNSHENWMENTFWNNNVLPALQNMTNQLSNISLKSTEIMGLYFDAKNQLETQLLLQTITARTHKDYHPSQGLCEIGTGVQSLALSGNKAEYNAYMVSRRAMDRNTGSAYTLGRLGDLSDKQYRIKQFLENFCDEEDNNSALAGLCNAGVEPAQENADIDFTATLDVPWTLDVDFSNTGTTPHEEEVLALGANLFSHNLFNRINAQRLEDDETGEITRLQEIYYDTRSVIAKRSVAENSFSSLVGEKSQGSASSREYIRELLMEMGLTTEEASKLMFGETWDATANPDINPSYYAQMEILSKKLVQSPEFYTNLYDKPANVDRKTVALQAIGLMQKFDLFKSYLRQEASLAVLLELALMGEQTRIENEINPR